MTSGSRRSSPGRPDLVRPRSLSQDLEELRAGRIEAGDRLRLVCDRVAAVDRVVHAFVVDAGRRGRVLAEADRPGDWSGIGVGVKDVIRVDGLPTTAGSSLPVAELAGPQASVVTRLRAAGASVVGKTVSAEFAVAAPGPTTNPYDRERTPGGSSSGSAAAVASGAVPLALGTQTVGSVVRPAAYCGVVGFKPSFDRVGLDGVIPNAPSLDTLGWFTATIADAALAAELLDPRWREVVEPVRPLVLGIPSPAYLALADADARAAFANQVERLRQAGHTIRPSALFAQAEEVGRRLFAINRWELARVHEAWFDRFADRYRPETAAAIMQGQQVDPDEYEAALAWRDDFRAGYAESTAAAGVDLWIAPAATGVAPRGLGSTGNSVMSFPFSLVGSPVVSIPAGHDADGLPFGLQCSTLVDQDERLLALVGQIERVVGGHLSQNASGSRTVADEPEAGA